MRIAMIGSGYVGLVSGACFADFGHIVTCVDKDPDKIAALTRGEMPIIGVGGIFGPDDAWEKITAGASLLQIYTGLVYEGPGLAKRIVAGLRERMIAAGVTELRAASGLDANGQVR
jgi:dihydroorotate dehydrogenase